MTNNQTFDLNLINFEKDKMIVKHLLHKNNKIEINY